MTISTAVNKWSYDGDDLQTVFPYLNKIYVETDLMVYLLDADGIETLQALNVDYTVSGTGETGGGDVIFSDPPATGETVIIVILLPYTQETSIPESGLLSLFALENALDRAVQLIQQLREKLGRTPKFSQTSELADVDIPDIEASKYLRGNAAGDGLEWAELFLSSVLVMTGMSVAGFVKNEADGTLAGGQSLAAGDMPSDIDAAKIADGSVSNTVFQYLAGVTSAIQTQLSAKQTKISVAVLQDVKATTVPGGSSVATTWTARDINTKASDDDGIVTLAGDGYGFILQPGTYLTRAAVPFYQTDKTQVRLYDMTAGDVALLGSNNEIDSGNNVSTLLFIEGIVKPTVPTTYRVQYFAESAITNLGLGYNSSSGLNEIYTQLIVQKLA